MEDRGSLRDGDKPQMALERMAEVGGPARIRRGTCGLFGGWGAASAHVMMRADVRDGWDGMGGGINSWVRIQLGI